MKRFTLLICMILLITCAAQAADREVRIATGEWVPWTGSALPHGGFINHVASLAFAKQGYTAIFEFYPWPRALEMVEYGTVHVSSYWFEDIQREKTCFYSAPINHETIVFFHRKDNPMKPWKNLIELKGYRIGVTKEVAYTEGFSRLGRHGTLKFYYSNTAEENFAKLLRGRVDIFPTAKLMGLQVLKSRFTPEEQEDIAHDRKSLTNSNGYLLFTKAHPRGRDLLKAFDLGLRQLHEDGTYDRLLSDLYEGKYSSN